MRSQDWFCFVLVIGIIGTVLFSASINVYRQNSSRYYYNRHKFTSKPSQRIISSFTKSTKEELLAKEEERVRKTAIILEALGSRNASELVMPYEDTIIIEPHKELPGGRKPFAVILVTTMAEDVERRNSIRETWYTWGDQLNCLTYFFMGLPRNETLEVIVEEANLHGDIIVDSFTEAYYKLTIKTLRTLKWYLSKYKKDPPAFYIKTDDDVFLNLPKIATYLKKITEKDYIGGMRYSNHSAHRNPYSKWYVPETVYPNDSYPTYASGPFYCISGGLVNTIYAESFQVPLIHLEDVYLLGLVANQRLNLTISNMRNIVEDVRLSKSTIRSRTAAKKNLAIHPIDSPLTMKLLFIKATCRRFRKNVCLSTSESPVIDSHYFIVLIASVITLYTQFMSYRQ